MSLRLYGARSQSLQRTVREECVSIKNFLVYLLLEIEQKGYGRICFCKQKTCISLEESLKKVIIHSLLLIGVDRLF